ncbi:hypothetical protein HYPSUDRAFT_47857, partial [Hypholoma sublateritium FD-334 SS-4]
ALPLVNRTPRRPRDRRIVSATGGVYAAHIVHNHTAGIHTPNDCSLGQEKLGEFCEGGGEW